MVSARDVYDDWYGDEDPRPLSLVRRPDLAFELIAPQDFGGAQRIADSLRAGVPVLVDLQGCDCELRGRLIDFASGLVYALEGSLQYIGRDVMLLAPDRVDVSGDDASAVREPGFHNRV